MRKNLISLEDFVKGNMNVNIVCKEFGSFGGGRKSLYTGLMRDLPDDLVTDLNKDYTLAYFTYSSVTHEPPESVEITFFRNQF